LTFEASVALILGENIGTTVTANLAAIGTNLAARRTAFAHFLFNFLGVAYMLLLMPFFMKFVSGMTPGDADFVIQTQQQAQTLGGAIGDKPFIARHIANTHTLFNIINTIVFLPLVGILAKLTTLVIRGKEEEMEFHLKYIDNRVLNTPPIALGQAKAETKRMGQIALEMLDETLAFLKDGNEKRIEVLEKKEDVVDLLQKEVTDFLVALSQKSISQDTSKEVASLMHMVNDLERVGDHCENLWRLGQKKASQKIVFSEIGNAELAQIGESTRDFLEFVLAGLSRGDVTILEKSNHMEDTVDMLEETMRNNHIARLNTGECAVLPGLIFIDMLHNFEKIGDHTYNVAQAVVGDK
uniref:Na/Pi cotransporter family protein n=1 Tax=Trichloromonas sp. TaxID=3069249 RepID=UPI003D81A36B